MDASGDSAPSGASSLERQLERFVRYLSLERGRSANTLRAYRQDLSLYFEYLSERGIAEPSAISSADIDGFTTGLHGVSRTVARRLSAVRSFHAFMVEDGVVTVDPSHSLHGPQQPDRLPKALGVHRVTVLLDSVGGDDPVSLRDRALLEVLYATGARVSEVTGLAIDDVFSGDGGPAEMLRVIGKGNRERIVPVGSFARSALEAYVVRARPLMIARARKSTPALFLGVRGAPLTRQHVGLIVKDRASKAGITEEVSPHTLRHSCATHLIAGGADIRVVQELLGHQSVQTTQIYTKVTIDSLRDVYISAHPRAR